MTDTLIFDSALRLLSDHADAATFAAVERREWPETLWKALVGAGFLDILESGVIENSGAALQVLRAQGQCAAPVPLMEGMIATAMGLGTGYPLRAGDPLLAALPYRADAPDLVTACWPGVTQALVCSADGAGFNATFAHVNYTDRYSYANEPQCVIDLSNPSDSDEYGRGDYCGDGSAMEWHPYPPPLNFDTLLQFCALARAALMRGALEHMLTLTVDYANTRVQFGKPLAKQQVIQHQLALMAEEVAAAGVAVDYATRSFSLSDAEARWQAVAAAKIRAGEAAGIAAAIAHQVHGAIGFTQEYQLQRYSRRVWTWRNEFGTEAEWSLLLGQRLSAAHAPPLWHTLTREPLAP